MSVLELFVLSMIFVKHLNLYGASIYSVQAKPGANEPGSYV